MRAWGNARRSGDRAHGQGAWGQDGAGRLHERRSWRAHRNARRGGHHSEVGACGEQHQQIVCSQNHHKGPCDGPGRHSPAKQRVDLTMHGVVQQGEQKGGFISCVTLGLFMVPFEGGTVQSTPASKRR